MKRIWVIKAGIFTLALLALLLGLNQFGIWVEGKQPAPKFRRMGLPVSSLSVCSTLEDGARCNYYADGVADQVEIQAAIDALPSSGGRVLLSGGKFILEAPVLLRDDLVLEGIGNGTLLAGYTTSNILKYEGIPGTETGRVTLRNFAVTGYGNKNAAVYMRGGVGHLLENLYVRAVNQGGYHPNESPHGIHLVGVLSSTLRNLNLGWNTGDGLRLERYEGPPYPVPTNAITIDSVRSHVNGGHGIYVGRSATGVRIVNSVIEGNAGRGVHLWITYTTQVQASYFEGNALGDIYVEAGNTVNIGGNYFGGPSPVHVEANGTELLIIQNNWLDGPAVPLVTDEGSTVVAHDNKGYP